MVHNVSRILLVGGLSVGLLVVAGCGAGSNASSSQGASTQSSADDAARFPRASSVGDGTSSTPPKIAASVRRAAAAAGCTVRAFPSEGHTHVDNQPVHQQSQPPTSGSHNAVWADFGMYSEPVPSVYLLHDLEHGAVVIHEGRSVPEATRTAIRRLWEQSPAYMIVVPGSTKGFPAGAVVATSWQRWMTCRTPGPKTTAALTEFRDVYRGTGPEGGAALNASTDATGAEKNLPTPSTPDTKAVSGA